MFPPALLLFSFFPTKCPDPLNWPCTVSKVHTFFPVTYLRSYNAQLAWTCLRAVGAPISWNFLKFGFCWLKRSRLLLMKKALRCALSSIYFFHLLNPALYVIGSFFKPCSIYWSYRDDVAGSSLAVVQRFRLKVQKVDSDESSYICLVRHVLLYYGV